MERPKLNEVPLGMTIFGGGVSTSENILMGPGEWEEELQVAYDAGHTLIEFDESEQPVRAYQKPPDVDR